MMAPTAPLCVPFLPNILKCQHLSLSITPASFFHPQIFLNYLGNYVPNMWNYEHGCILCDKDILDLSQLNVSPLNGLILISFALRPPDARLQCFFFFKPASPWALERMKHCSDLPLGTIHQFLSRQEERGPACPIWTDKQHGW